MFILKIVSIFRFCVNIHSALFLSLILFNVNYFNSTVVWLSRLIINFLLIIFIICIFTRTFKYICLLFLANFTFREWIWVIFVHLHISFIYDLLPQRNITWFQITILHHGISQSPCVYFPPFGAFICVGCEQIFRWFKIRKNKQLDATA